MSTIEKMLTPARTLCRVSGVSQKRIFETAAEFISADQSALSTAQIFSSLLAREKLGSTGLGMGIAIPHCRINNCSHAVGSLITLSTPIDLNAPDDIAVDILFVLLVPEQAHEEHLNILSGLARQFSDEAFCRALREAQTSQQLFAAACAFEL